MLLKSTLQESRKLQTVAYVNSDSNEIDEGAYIRLTKVNRNTNQRKPS